MVLVESDASELDRIRLELVVGASQGDLLPSRFPRKIFLFDFEQNSLGSVVAKLDEVAFGVEAEDFVAERAEDEAGAVRDQDSIRRLIGKTYRIVVENFVGSIFC